MKSKHQQSTCVTGNSRLLSCINVSLGSLAPVFAVFTAGTFQKQKPQQAQRGHDVWQQIGAKG